MKKAAALLIALIIIILCGCNDKGKEENRELPGNIYGVWISCYELSPMLKGGNFKEEFSACAEQLGDMGITDAFVHMRAFGESLFKSEYYPISAEAAAYSFDVPEYMITTLHNAGVRFHAWINPYRQSDGSFANPASPEVRARVTGGVREILGRYDIAGIHFDDYFYPAGDADAADYENYRAAAVSPLTLAEYRTANITALISAIKSVTAEKGVIFSVSPAADIQKNKNTSFADVAAWCKNGAVDLIIPQLYFGFDYPDERFRFNSLLKEWKELAGEKVKLVIGLAAYKLGTDSAPDTHEWKEGADILPRQTEICLNDPAVGGVCFFSFSYLFKEDPLHKEALSGIKECIAPRQQIS